MEKPAVHRSEVWLRQARDALEEAIALYDQHQEFLSLSYARQACVDALKAYLAAYRESSDLPETRSVSQLLQDARQLNSAFRFVEAATHLDYYPPPPRDYTETLRPGVAQRFLLDDPETAERGLEQAQQVLSQVESLLQRESA